MKEAFQAQGFGTLTEVDVRATPKEKLDEETEPYAILGFCNPDWPTVRLPSNRRSGFCCPATLSSAGMTSRPWFMLSMQG